MASSDIRRLGSHTVIYGAGYVLTRMIPFLLLPFYTHHISSAEYGVLQLVYAAVGFMNIVYHYGMDSAFLRFYVKKDADFDGRDVFTRSFVSLLLSGSLFSSLIYFAAEPLSLFLLESEAYSGMIRLGAAILVVDTLFNIPLHYLRMVNKPLVFNAVNLLNVALMFALNILFIRGMGRGIEYVLVSNLAASLLSLFLLLPVILRNLRFRRTQGLWKKMLLFGLPFIPGGLASMTLELIGRYMLQRMTDLETVGLYSAGYKLGIFMLVIITAYKFAWQPFFLNKGDDPDAAQVFARIMTFFLYVLLSVFLAVSFFIRDILRMRVFGVHFFDESYWLAADIVPIVLAAYIFLGIYMNLLPAIYFSEKTWSIPLFSGSAAAVNILCNLFLIPAYGMTGAAWSAFAAYAWMAVLTWAVTRHWYPIPYQMKQLLILSVAAVAAFFGGQYLFPLLWFKGLLLLLFILLPFKTGIIRFPEQLLKRRAA